MLCYHLKTQLCSEQKNSVKIASPSLSLSPSIHMFFSIFFIPLIMRLSLLSPCVRVCASLFLPPSLTHSLYLSLLCVYHTIIRKIPFSLQPQRSSTLLSPRTYRYLLNSTINGFLGVWPTFTVIQLNLPHPLYLYLPLFICFSLFLFIPLIMRLSFLSPCVRVCASLFLPLSPPLSFFPSFSLSLPFPHCPVSRRV